MYVLEGVTPCIQSMQLQAGDVGNKFKSLESYGLMIQVPSTSHTKLGIVHMLPWLFPLQLSLEIFFFIFFNLLFWNHKFPDT